MNKVYIVMETYDNGMDYEDCVRTDKIYRVFSTLESATNCAKSIKSVEIQSYPRNITLPATLVRDRGDNFVYQVREEDDPECYTYCDSWIYTITEHSVED